LTVTIIDGEKIFADCCYQLPRWLELTYKNFQMIPKLVKIAAF